MTKALLPLTRNFRSMKLFILGKRKEDFGLRYKINKDCDLLMVFVFVFPLKRVSLRFVFRLLAGSFYFGFLNVQGIFLYLFAFEIHHSLLKFHITK